MDETFIRHVLETLDIRSKYPGNYVPPAFTISNIAFSESQFFAVCDVLRIDALQVYRLIMERSQHAD